MVDRIVSMDRAIVLFMVSLSVAFRTAAGSDPESDYYRIISIHTPSSQSDSRSANWKPSPDGLPLEVSGLAVLDHGRLGVAIRKGEVWILDHVYDDPPSQVSYRRFASGLHEPLGLLWHQGSFYAAQRSELTRMTDLDGDGQADEYRTIAKGWGLSGHYHEYAYGPKLDREGNLWITLNIGLGLNEEQKKRSIHEPTLGYHQGKWRGWGLKVTPQGEMIPMSAGMRSPSGIGANDRGDMFYTDQQGDWVATNSLNHMQRGSFSHHPESLASMHLDGSPIQGIRSHKSGYSWPEAVRLMPHLKPPAVWFPYKKVGQSATDILLDQSGGKFGPFSGQLFVGEFTLASIHRCFLEQIDGEYQGACFPFRRGLASAVLRLAQGPDGSVFAGLTNRGWSSIGSASYGLQRLVWTGKTPFEIREMRAKSDGFELVLTEPAMKEAAIDPKSYAIESYTYKYHSVYGSDEIEKQSLRVEKAILSDDGYQVRLYVSGLRPYFVHELQAKGLRNRQGKGLLHPEAYYTLNRIPGESSIVAK